MRHFLLASGYQSYHSPPWPFLVRVAVIDVDGNLAKSGREALAAARCLLARVRRQCREKRRSRGRRNSICLSPPPPERRAKLQTLSFVARKTRPPINKLGLEVLRFCCSSCYRRRRPSRCVWPITFLGRLRRGESE